MKKNRDVVVAQWHKRVTVNAVVESIPALRIFLFFLLYFHFFALVPNKGKTR